MAYLPYAACKQLLGGNDHILLLEINRFSDQIHLRTAVRPIIPSLPLPYHFHPTRNRISL